MATSTTLPSEATAEQVPELLGPIDKAPVEGSAATFTWTPVPRAIRYRLQVSKTPAFKTFAFNALLQNTTSLTLYAMLPEEGDTFYWRVQAGDATTWFPWSEAGVFRAVTDAEADAYEAKPQRKTEEAPTEAPASTPGAQVPVQTSATSAVQAALFIILILIGACCIVGILYASVAAGGV